MNRKEILNLINIGEGYTLDFKEAIPSDLGKLICAFANASGGRIILGVRDNGTILGHKLTNSDEAKINSIARNIEPSASISIEKVDEFVVIHVPEGKDKPYSSGGHFYMRTGSISQQLRRNEIREFFMKERIVRFDEKPNKDFDLEKDFYREGFKSYISKAGITPLANEKDMLRNLDLFDGEYMKNAGVLFFTSRITKFFLGATIVCALYQGTTKQQILDRKEFDADLISNYENAFTYLRSKLNTKFIIKKERTEQLELPEEALREALINAVVHRDYFSSGHVQVDIYNDRVDISNPGGLVSGLRKEDLGRRSMPRNPLLMDLFLRIDRVEKIGSGIGRITKAMAEYGLPVDFDADENWFSVVFHRKKDTPQKTPQKTPQITELERRILDEIERKPGISRNEIADALKLSPETIKEYIEKLKDKGVLRRIGPDKGGYWEVLK